MIIDVDNIAKKHDLSLLNIAVTGDTGGSSTLGPDTRQYGTMNLSFNVATTYDRFKTFLADLERSLRILDIESITFGEPNPVGNTTYTLRVRTYWLK